MENNLHSIFTRDDNRWISLDGDMADDSFNGIARHLGYNEEQFHMLLCEEGSQYAGIAFKVFTRDPLFICTRTAVSQIDDSELQKCLSAINWDFEYGSFTVENILSRGIENQSLDITFLSSVLNFTHDDTTGIFLSERLGLFLYFRDGILESYTSSDGLGKSAKWLKRVNKDLLDDYGRVAMKYHHSDIRKAIFEVNMQAQAMTAIPNATNNLYCSNHLTENGLVNYYNLNVAHYGGATNVEEFKAVNAGRYTIENDQDNPTCTKIKVGLRSYTFDAGGSLKNTAI